MVGWNIAQLEGKKSLCNEVTIITKRSNHIPIFTTIDNIGSTGYDIFFVENYVWQGDRYSISRPVLRSFGRGVLKIGGIYIVKQCINRLWSDFFVGFVCK